MKQFEFEKTNRELLDFLDSSPVSFWAVRNMKEMLSQEGFEELREGEHWQLNAGGSYFVSRNDSALIAFRIPEEDFIGFQMMASHCDSPVFKIKTNAEITVDKKYVKLNVEKYGGMMCAPWLDRPLSVAGRVIVEKDFGPEAGAEGIANAEAETGVVTKDSGTAVSAAAGGEAAAKSVAEAEIGVGTTKGATAGGEVAAKSVAEAETGVRTTNGATAGGEDAASAVSEIGIETRLINIDRDLLIIPNLAIHMNREVNDGYKFNAQKDMLPLFAGTDPQEETNGGRGGFPELVASEAGVTPDRILDTDLFLYNRMKGSVVGLRGEFISSGRLDDLQCAFASLKGIIGARPRKSVAVHCVFDNEEVGSGTKQGAAGTFLRDVLRRINAAFGRSEEDYLRAIASSFMVSADNAHSVHPNQSEKADPTNRPYMNGGIVIKYSANQKYTTDAVSGAIFRAICKKAGVPYQTFANRSDMIGGSTLGNISQSQVALNTVDIGLAQLAMHSPYETAGARDTAYLVEAAKVLFSASVEGSGDGNYRLIF